MSDSELRGAEQHIAELQEELMDLRCRSIESGDRLSQLPDDACITRAELRDLLDISDRTLARMIADGRLPPPFRDGGHRWLVGSIRAVYRERQREAELAAQRTRASRQRARWN